MPTDNAGGRGRPATVQQGRMDRNGALGGVEQKKSRRGVRRDWDGICYPVGLFGQIAYFGINAPLLLGKAAVVVVAPLGVGLGGGKELGGLGGILLHH